MTMKTLVGAVALALVLGGAAQAQTSTGSNNAATPSNQPSVRPASNGTPGNIRRFGSAQLTLTGQQENALRQAAADLPEQELAPSVPVAPGTKLPSDLKLSAIPRDVTQHPASEDLQNLKLVKVDNGNVLVVNPDNDVIQAIIADQDATRAARGRPSAGESASSSRKGGLNQR